MTAQKNNTVSENGFDRGYRTGTGFARHEADYDERAAVYRAGGIPANWALYRAEILNRHLGDKGFNFQAYTAGFARACINSFERV